MEFIKSSVLKSRDGITSREEVVPLVVRVSSGTSYFDNPDRFVCEALASKKHLYETESSQRQAVLARYVALLLRLLCICLFLCCSRRKGPTESDPDSTEHEVPLAENEVDYETKHKEEQEKRKLNQRVKLDVADFHASRQQAKVSASNR
eukprot:GHVU01132987.1.p2 GENE.GHVU01132987.1~~GHVU01132987.1.p2  ORF type:complete len:149 (+),score=20.80 GHVU01132987.1:156-602(+)